MVSGAPDSSNWSSQYPSSPSARSPGSYSHPFRAGTNEISNYKHASSHLVSGSFAFCITMPAIPLQSPQGRLTIWKGGGQGSCIFNSCSEKGISAGLICIYGEPWWNSLYITTLKAAGALLEWLDLKEGRAPAALIVVVNRLTIWKGGQGSCVYIWRICWNPLFITTIKAAGALLEWPDLKQGRAPATFKCCVEEGISPGSPYIQLRPVELPFSIQLLKIQEPPCPPFQTVSLFERVLGVWAQVRR